MTILSQVIGLVREFLRGRITDSNWKLLEAWTWRRGHCFIEGVGALAMLHMARHALLQWFLPMSQHMPFCVFLRMPGDGWLTLAERAVVCVQTPLLEWHGRNHWWFFGPPAPSATFRGPYGSIVDMTHQQDHLFFPLCMWDNSSHAFQIKAHEFWKREASRNQSVWKAVSKKKHSDCWVLWHHLLKASSPIHDPMVVAARADPGALSWAAGLSYLGGWSSSLIMARAGRYGWCNHPKCRFLF